MPVRLVGIVALLAVAVIGWRARLSEIHEKERLLGPFLKPGLHHTEKIRGPLNVAIELLHDDGETVRLRGVITSRRALDEVEFAWSLPVGVELISGELESTLRLARGEPYVVDLVVKKLSNNNQQIHFHAQSSAGGARFGDTAQYNTEVQQILSGVDHKAVAQKSLKIFH